MQDSGARSRVQSAGLWLLTLNNETPVRLVGNRYLEAGQRDVSDVRSIADPVWSPDGTALIVTAYYWEWSDILWLDPIAPDPDEANLHDPPVELSYGAWLNDSQSLLLCNANYAQFGDLVRVRRDSNEAERLIEGKVEGLFIHNAQELPSGIAFLAFPARHGDQVVQLYLGQQAADGFSYAPAGPDRNICNTSLLWDVAWDPTGRLATVSCDGGVQVISLDGNIDVDLAPFLGPIAGQDDLRVFWGPSGNSD